ncbi:MAG: threonine--tRNA ligase [Candidatus Lloydbacteria bacterium RIFCSPLOWO2_02_FULL_54_12]|nr:MAG: threonine--tRNA ligase [Candidatus Lloydbacteria bacterium RIFCSPLOWO2_02_FULL_54_12]
MPDDKLHNIRHTLAHLLAMAAKEFDPAVKLGIGPVTDDGFYYDFQFTKAPTSDDLKEMEKTMRKLVNKKLPMGGREIDKAEGEKLFSGQPFKLELLAEYATEGKTLTAYTSGDFTDLCKGGHVENTGEIAADAFKLTRIAGAYWRGSEKNPQLTRIYGLAFSSRKELDLHLHMLEEAKKRDHRKLGKELGLFVFSDLVGAGLPLWTPKGTIVRELLNDYVWELRKARGYQKVTIPHITRKALYETSGHWKKFSDELFRITTREGHEYAMKPMNCPHHAQIFAAEPKSYRDMPVRYSETTMVYRDEQSGELSGLTRVLSITQDDAHVFCRESQIADEIFAIWDIVDEFYGAFGYTERRVRFSRHDPEKFEKYLGTPDIWKKAEGAIRDLMTKRGGEYIDGAGEAAMYGPKIDFLAKDSLGRTFQVATIQLDFNQPANFGLVSTNEKGEKEQVVMIHCAIMGSIERFTAALIEHTGGNFPLWLSPVQVAVLPIGEAHLAFAGEIAEKLKDRGFRVEFSAESESLGKKVRWVKMQKIPYTVVVGDAEVAKKAITLESRDKGKLGEFPLEELLHFLQEEATAKR